jgi:Cytochrome P460
MKSVCVVLALVISVGAALATDRAIANKTSGTLSSDNELLLPANYRNWVALSPGAPGMPQHRHEHTVGKVYVEPSAYEKFVKTSMWPNETVIVLELRDKTTPPKTMCDGMIGLEVAVKNESKAAEPWTFYGMIYDGHKHSGEQEQAKKICVDCSDEPMDVRLAMYFPALKAVIHAKPRNMPPAAF